MLVKYRAKIFKIICNGYFFFSFFLTEYSYLFIGSCILVASVLVNRSTFHFSSQTKESIEALLNAVRVGKHEWNSLALSHKLSQCNFNCWTMHNAETHTQVNKTKQKPLRSQKHTIVHDVRTLFDSDHSQHKR